MPEIDVDTVLDFIILGVILIAIIIACYTQYQYLKTKEQRTTCKSNPSERYAQNCTSYDECIEKCTERLYATT